jgi:hypothetical protein
VLEAAKANGEYSAAEHERCLLAGNQANTQATIEWARTLRRQVETWGRSDSGIERTPRDGVYQVDRPTFERFAQRQASQSVTDVRSMTADRERAKNNSRDTGRA